MRRILVAVDTSPHAREVLEAAIDLARRTGAGIWLLRAVALPADLPTAAFATPPALFIEGALLTARRDLAELSNEIPAELFQGATARLGVAWEAICSSARLHDVDVIVIGSHGYRLLDRIVGTTAAKVVNHAGCPVLVVPPGSRSVMRHASAAVTMPRCGTGRVSASSTQPHEPHQEARAWTPTK